MHTRAIEYLRRQRNAVGEINPVRVHGRVTRVVGLVMEGLGPGSSVGEFCHVYPKDGHEPIQCEVVGFSDDKILLMPLGEVRGIGPGSKIVSKRVSASVKVGPGLLGRTLDGLGSPLDGLGSFEAETEYPLYSTPPNPLSRKRIEEPLNVGIRAINSVLTVGKGQRIGIFAGSGVGKSVLMGMMARNTEADVNVIGLIGERGREVKEFIEKDLGEEGLKRSVLVVATSDQPPLLRMRAPMVATAIAEYFRDQGKNVLLMMDSISRFCMAQREIGLAIGEPPATKGYPPSVFAHLPRLLERAGTSEGKGSITGFYTILAEGDDVNDPVADAARAVLDGHIVLSRELAHQAHYPAIDVLSSISRVMNDIVNPEHRKAATRLRSVLSTYKKAYDLISIGAYKKGSDPAVDHAIEVIDKVNAFLRQDISEGVGYDNSLQALFALPA
ncbi:MAG: flagellar protein export ATPase FliI [Thermodesulfobacteriota bacterium]|nr:MAG: flagellar protein export ATPase FliI [Thermodesulfobacteriota bacterium]